ncbi:SDR family oxidoreductase [Spirosoma montaniterrae]|uniref:Short-chain dehydrogenase n=1 Tax=Spirosoma montaniterrae TaxID=1178516 RepID=A0A1P9X1P1_9BACT|nr:SDR family oxidoreductase [Spirosoma montaniterrae]AQG81544.1 hypothetical protein AWR27_20835 [Spirosoma montaniterrae]
MKTILITGATEGVGKATAHALAGQGHRLILHGRNAGKLKATLAELKAATGNPNLTTLVADLSSLNAVRQLADTIRRDYNQIDVLINNAGAMFSQRTVSSDGFEMMIAVNYFATVVLTENLLPLLKATPGSRIVILSSVGYKQAKPNFDDFFAERNYAMQRDYFNSKLYCLYYALDLAERLRNSGVTVNAVHPGGVRTQLARDFKGPMKWLFSAMMPLFFVSPEQGAETSVYVATAPELNTVTGRYFTKRSEETLKPIGTNAAYRQKLWALTEQYIGQFLVGAQEI